MCHLNLGTSHPVDPTEVAKILFTISITLSLFIVIRRRLQESNQEGGAGDIDESCRPAALAQERVDLIEALAQKPDVYERLARAIAPSIYENEDIKKGILLQMFGGAKKDWGNTGRGGFRAEVNILLCGDPGTSKSQLLQYVFNLVPRSVVLV